MSEQVATSEQNHRSAIDDLLGETPQTIVPETPATPPGIVPETPPVVPPVADTPPATPQTPEVPAVPETPSTPWTEKITEISNGSVKSEDDFLSIFNQANKATDLESQLLQRDQELETLRNANPYANDYIKKLNELYASGADTNKVQLFNRINQLGDVTNLSSRDALKWQMMEQHNLTDTEAEVMLKTRYKTDDTIHADEDVQAANIQQKIDGDTAKQYLKGLQASFETQAPTPEIVETPEQIKLREQQFEAQVAPIVKSIETELPSYFSNVNVNGLQGDKAVTIDLPIPAEVQTHIGSQVKQFALDHQIDTTKPENIEGLKTYAKNLAKIAMYDSHMIDANNKRDMAVRAEFHNPSTIDRGKDNPATPAANSRQATAARIAETM